MRKACLVFCSLLCVVTIAGATAPEVMTKMAPSAATVTAPDAVSPLKLAVEMGLLHQRLVSERPEGETYNLGALTAAESARLAGDEVNQNQRLLVGVDRSVDAIVDVASTEESPAKLSSTNQVGSLHTLIDGAVVWSATFRSPGATALRAHLVDIDLPDGVLLYAYGETGDAYGPYTGNGSSNRREVWTNTVLGDVLTLQLEIAAPVTEEQLWGSYFSVASVGHMGDRFNLARWQDETPEKSFCTINADCVENADCSSVPGAIAAAEPAVAEMLYASRSSYYICTGTLMADTGGSMTPYFLTANHCISTSDEAASLETYWDFTAPCGTTACSYAWEIVGRATPGAVILSGNDTSDYTLLQLDAIPSGRTFLGWTAAAVANSNGTDLYRLSHPSGAPQAYSTHDVDTSKYECSSWPRGSWIYSKDTYGATEGGSSGSAVLNSSGLIVGQLSGACGFNLNDVCDAESNATVDGALAAYYSSVSQWLDAGACDPSPEVCDDGIDNDCDGLVDQEDPDCDSCTPETEVCDGVDNDCDGLIDEDGVCDAPACLEYGERCTVNADCCSDYCRGNRNKKCR
ncbi:MAG: serine protease [Acidobacteriota bacterium]